MISNLNALPQVLFCGFDDFSWCTSKIAEHVLREACLNSFIASMELGPCFLKEKHPQFVTVGLREGTLLLEAGNVVINNNLFPLAIFADLEAINAQVILLVVKEKFGDTGGLFGEH